MVTERVAGASAGTLGLPDAMTTAIFEFQDLRGVAAASAVSLEFNSAMRQCKENVVENLLFKRSPRTAMVRLSRPFATINRLT